MDRDIIFAADKEGSSDYIVVDGTSGIIKKLGRGMPPRPADVSIPSGAAFLPGDLMPTPTRSNRSMWKLQTGNGNLPNGAVKQFINTVRR